MPPCSCARHFHLGRRGLLAAGFACAMPARADAPVRPRLTPEQAMANLLDGHRRFLAGEAPPADDPVRRAALARRQAPYAAILACADSRVPPELLFTAAAGDLFVVRNAGNIAGTAALGSLEYAVASLGVPLVVVLGHERCGAADAAVKVARDELALPGALGEMLLPMLPAALAGLRAAGDPVEGTVLANIRRMTERVRHASTVIAAAVAEGRVQVVGAHADLDDGRVTLMA
jgi:carbonic anhydrase